MAHNTRTRANLVAWQSPTAAVTPTEIDKIDGYAFASINGDAGGVWAPVTVIEIGGAGLEVSGDFLSSGAATFEGLTVLAGDVEVDGQIDFNDLVTFNGQVAFNDPIVFQDNVAFNDPVDFNDDVTFDDVVEFNQPVTFDGLTTFNVLVTMTDDLAVSGDIDCDDLLVRGNLTVGNDPSDELIVNGISTFNGDVLIEDDFQVGTSEADTMTVEAVAQFNGDTTFADDVTLGTLSSHTITIGGTPTLAAVMQFSGNGRVPLQPIAIGDASVTITPRTVNAVRMTAAPTTDRTLLIDDTDCEDGDFLLLSLRAPLAGTDHLRVERPGGTAIINLQGDGGNRHLFWAMRVSGSWAELN